MKDLRWDDIELFLCVSKAGSFAKAATFMDATQPTISRRVDNLEARLGAVLFERVPTGVNLTACAMELLPVAERMAGSAQLIRRIADSQHNEVEGSVCISAPDGLAAFWMVPNLVKLQDGHPNLFISMDSGLWTGKHGHMSSDICLHYEDPEDEDTIRVPLCWMHYTYFATQEYIDRHGSPQSIAQLLSHKTIFHVAQVMQQHRWPEKTTAANNLRTSQFITNSSAASLMALRSGIGIGPAPSAAADLFPELVPLPLGLAASLRLYLYYRKESANVARVRAVKDWLMELFSPKEHIWFGEEFVDPYEVRASESIGQPIVA